MSLLLWPPTKTVSAALQPAPISTLIESPSAGLFFLAAVFVGGGGHCCLLGQPFACRRWTVGVRPLPPTPWRPRTVTASASASAVDGLRAGGEKRACLGPAERPFRGSRKEGWRGSARRGERTGPFRRQRDHAHRLFREPSDASAAGKSGGGIFFVFFIIIAESSLLRKHSESVT